MIIKSLSLQGFKSFRTVQTISFDRDPGLYLLAGENRIESRLGSNGAGKSTVWSALCWLFYGKDPRGLRASNVATWSEGPITQVSAEIQKGLRTFELRRTWNPNAIYLNDEPATEEDVLELVGLEFDPFLSSVLMSQFRPMFLDRSPSDRAELFSAVMNLERWLKFSEIAADRSKALQESIQDRRLERAGICGAWDAIASHDWHSEIDLWNVTAGLELEELEDKRQAVQIELQTAQKARDKLDIEIQELNKWRNGIVEDINTLLERIESIQNNEIAHETVTANVASRMIEQYKRDIKDIRNADVCPVCKQNIDPEHKRKEIIQISTMMDQHERDHTHASDKLIDLKHKLSEHESVLEATRANQEEVDQSLMKVRSRRSEMDARCREQRQILENLENRLDQYEVNPYIEKRREAKRRQHQLTKRLFAVEDRIEETEAIHYRTHFWVKGFRDVRLFLINEALTHLTLEVNEALEHLGMREWAIEFVMDRPTKAGSLKRGFQALIQAPHNGEEFVPWESWSGGESQRLRLACNLGLASLIADHTGARYDLEIWDEPSNWLSAEGIDDLLHILKERADRMNKQIWIVDHRNLGFGGFSDTVTVIKDSNGSYFDG